MTRRGRNRLLLAWLAVGLWAGILLLLGGEWFSASHTGGILGPLLRWLVPGIEPDSIRAIHGLLRKAAHVLGYAVLALLALRALRIGSPARPLRAASLAMGLVVAVAVADESRQARLASRTGSLRHVALDGMGGAGALVATQLASVVRRRRPRAGDPRPGPGSNAPGAA